MKFLSEKFKDTNDKKKIENLFFLIGILVVTLLIINYILKNTEEESLNYENSEEKSNIENIVLGNEELSKKIEDILQTIKGVGKVKVLLNYEESSTIVPIYDETTTTSNTEEDDGTGGTRNVTQVQSQKDIVFSEKTRRKRTCYAKENNAIYTRSYSNSTRCKKC